MSNENNTTNKPSKCKEIILYSDDPIHSEYINLLMSDRRCVGVLHDKDIDDDGNAKKPHYHFVIKFDNTATEGTVLKILPNLKPNYIRYVKSERGMMRYLLHLDNPEKAQYSIDNLVGNVNLAKRYCNTSDYESDGIKKIITYLDSRQMYKITDRDMLLWCCNNDLYSVYRRSAYIMCRLLDQHNKHAERLWVIELAQRAKEWGVEK